MGLLDGIGYSLVNNGSNVNNGLIGQEHFESEISTPLQISAFSVLGASGNSSVEPAEAASYTSSEPEKTTDTPKEEITADENKIKSDIKSVIQEAGVKISESDLNEIISTYKPIIDYNVQNNIPVYNESGKLTDSLKDRIIRYAKGLCFHNQEKPFENELAKDNNNYSGVIELKDIKAAVEANDTNAYKAAFHEMARQYIELYDTARNGKADYNGNGDNKIDVQELIFREAKEEGRTFEGEELEIVTNEAINRVAALDINGDNYLDENEIAAYLWAMSKVNDGTGPSTAGDITYEEWSKAQQSLGIFSGLKLTNAQDKLIHSGLEIMSKNNIIFEKVVKTDDLSTLGLNSSDVATLGKAKELMMEQGFTQEMFDNYARFRLMMENGYNGLKIDL